MKELADNMDIKSYCEQISEITGINIELLEKLICYVIIKSGHSWYESFEVVISELLTENKEENLSVYSI